MFRTPGPVLIKRFENYGKLYTCSHSSALSPNFALLSSRRAKRSLVSFVRPVLGECAEKKILHANPIASGFLCRCSGPIQHTRLRAMCRCSSYSELRCQASAKERLRRPPTHLSLNQRLPTATPHPSLMRERCHGDCSDLITVRLHGKSGHAAIRPGARCCVGLCPVKIARQV